MTSNTNDTGSSSTSKIPSPTEEFNKYLPIITTALDQMTTAANGFPATRSDINFHRTMDRQFANDLDDASSRVLRMTERLLALVDAGQWEVKGKGKKGEEAVRAVPKTASKTRRKLEEEEDVIDGYKRGVLGVVDGLLEDADSCLDDLSGQRKKAAIPIPADKLAAAGDKLPGPFAQGKSLGRLPSSILHDSSLAKPQLLFSDNVDNISTAPWKPTLDTKEHAMVPLGFDVPLEYELTPEERAEPEKAEARKKRETRLATHPYYYETRHLPYPTSMFTITEPREPASFEETPFTFVDTPEALEKMVEKLQQAKEIAVDLEHHSLRTYYGITCLIQISDRNEDWIVDTLALRTELREKKLGGVMTDPSIIKVLHGSDSDIHWLQRDFDIYIVNLFDTFHATKVLGFAQHSLAYLLSHYCQFEADKRYQMADWRARPLPEKMMDYARSDTHFLLYIYDRLRNALLEESSRPPSPVDGADVDMVTQRRNPQEAMRSVLERSGDTALRMYEREMYDSEKGRGSGGWANAARKSLYQGAIEEEVGAVFKAVHAWRDQLARTEDEAPTYLMPNDLLKAISVRHFSTSQQLETTLHARAPFVAARAKELMSVISDARKAYQASKRPIPSSANPDPAPDVPSITETIAPFPSQSTATTVDDVWDDLISNSNPNTTTSVPTKPPAKSSLFGSTIASSKKQFGLKATTPKGKNSALFGKTISSKASKAPSPTYEDVTSRIFRDLIPAAKPQAVESKPGEASKPKPLAISSSSKESIPVPSVRGFDTVDEDPEASADLPEPSPPKRPKTDEVVQVKKKSSKPKTASKVKPETVAGSSSQSETLTAETAPAKSKSKESSKSKKRSAEVPEFDYSQAPNLLDNPKSGIKDQGKKKKKERKERKEFTGADFGPAPKEKSNMRAGNKSGTF